MVEYYTMSLPLTPTWRQRLCRSPAVWLAGLGVVLLVRFPVNFLLHPPFLMDFDLFHTIALRILQGDAVHLYEPAGSPQSLFKYAPSWALLIAPFGWVSGHAGAVLWSSLTVIWLLLTCWIADRLCRLIGLTPKPFLAVAAVLLLVRPLISEFTLGQTNLLWGMLVAGFLFFEVTRRPWWAAICLALAISLKLPAALFVVYLALRRSWKLVSQVILCGAAINGVAALVLLPPHPTLLFSSWLRVLMISGPDRAFEIGSQSLLALLGRLLRNDGYGLNLLVVPDSTVVLLALLGQAVLFGALFFPRRLALPDTTRTVVDGALLAVLMALFSPTCWMATYNASLFSVFLAVALFTARPQTTLRSLSLAVGAAAVVLCSLLTHAKVWHALGVRAFKGESYVYLVLMILPLLGLSVTWYLWHQRLAIAHQSPMRL